MSKMLTRRILSLISWITVEPVQVGFLCKKIECFLLYELFLIVMSKRPDFHFSVSLLHYVLHLRHRQGQLVHRQENLLSCFNIAKTFLKY